MSKIRSIMLCLIAAYVQMMSWGLSGALGILLIELQELFDSSKVATVWVSSLFKGVCLCVGPVTGVLVKRYGCRNISTLGSVILTGSLVASYFTPSLEVLYVTFAVAGIGVSFMHAAAFVVVIQNFDKHRSLALGLSGSGTSVAYLVLPYLTFAASETFGVRRTFLVLAALTSQAMVCSMMFEILSSGKNKANRNEAVEAISKEKSCFGALKNHFNFCTGGYFVYTISYFSYSVGYSITYILFPDMALSRGVSKEQASIVATCIGVGAIIGRLSFTFIGDIIRIDPIFLHIVPTLLFAIFILIVAFVWEYSGFIAIAVLAGITAAIQGVIQPAILADMMGSDDISVALGWVWFIASIPSALGPPLAGWLADIQGGYQNAQLCSGSFLIFSALTSILAFWLQRCQAKDADFNRNADRDTEMHVGYDGIYTLTTDENGAGGDSSSNPHGGANVGVTNSLGHRDVI